MAAQLVLLTFTFSCLLTTIQEMTAACASLNGKIPLLPITEKLQSLTETELHALDDMRVSYIQSKLRLSTEKAAAEIFGIGLRTPNYVIDVALGTPPRNMTWKVDTAYDITWTQCQPCDSCYRQLDPVFEPRNSSSYGTVDCGNVTQCAIVLGPYIGDTLCGAGGACQYKQMYADISITTGDFATDVLQIAGAGAVRAYKFGCGHSNQGAFSFFFSGILSLTRDPLALPSQARTPTFAYCLPALSSGAAGFLEFGPAASSPASSCARLFFVRTSSLYVVNVTSVVIDRTPVARASPFFMVLDSGTFITRLEPKMYNAIRDAFVSATASFLTPTPAVSGFDTCFTSSSAAAAATRLPTISLLFTGAATPYTLPDGSALYNVSGTNASCFAFHPTLSSPAIFGNFHQLRRRFTMDISGSRACCQPTGSSC